MIRMLPKLLNFNPRSREGSDALLDTRKQNLTYFNPRSREGSDPRKYMHMILRGFQSTLP